VNVLVLVCLMMMMNGFGLMFVECFSNSSYVAAVAQHFPYQGSLSNVSDIKWNNLDRYELFAAAASKAGAQVIVYPEFGLGGDYSLRNFVLSFAENIDDIQLGDNPANDPKRFQPRMALYRASCIARNYSIVVSINMLTSQSCTNPNVTCGKDGFSVYNSEFVFERDGSILSIYHKSHVYYVFTIQQPSNPDKVTLTTNFGVTFGLFICFDIMFPSPSVDLVNEGIKHFLYSASVGQAGKTLLIQSFSSSHGVTMVSSNLATSASNFQDSAIFANGATVSSDEIGVCFVDGSCTSILVAKILTE